MKRYVGVAAILLATSAGAAVLVDRAEPPDLRSQIETRMRDALEQPDLARHNHGDHAVQVADPTVVCGVRLYGYEPSEVTEIAQVRTVYGFHLCGVAEPRTPWDVAVKLAGPVILDLSTDPAGIQVVEATEKVRYVDRLREMFPPKYAKLARTEALTPAENTDLRSRYDDAAGL